MHLFGLTMIQVFSLSYHIILILIVVASCKLEVHQHQIYGEERITLEHHVKGVFFMFIYAPLF